MFPKLSIKSKSRIIRMFFLQMHAILVRPFETASTLTLQRARKRMRAKKILLTEKWKVAQKKRKTTTKVVKSKSPPTMLKLLKERKRLWMPNHLMK